MDGITQVATYLGEVKKAGPFPFWFRTAGGSLTWLESYVRAKALTKRRKSGVLVSPGIKKTSLVKWCNISPYHFRGGLPVTTPACISALEMSLVPKGSRRDCRACSLFGFGPGEAVARRNGIHVGAGDWDTWVRAPVAFPSIRGRKPGRFGGVSRQSGAVTVNRPDTRPDADTSVATTAG